MCLADGDQCHDMPGECCNGTCTQTAVDKECGPPGCLQVDTALCTSSSQCCSHYCNTNSTPTWPAHCSTCGGSGDACVSTAECCNFGGVTTLNCINGTCM